LTVFNAVTGLRQEAKAEESVQALSQMMQTIARVRRDGLAVEVDASELVPGDVILVEAGNRVPADGRVSLAATLEIEEAALTGESLPVGKQTNPVSGDDVPLGDRVCMAYMNTSVTRGRGELIVTATGMDTEIGHIADLLANTEAGKTPLQKQLDSLSKIIASIAAVALVVVVLLGRAGGVLRHPLRDRGGVGSGCYPDRAAGGGHGLVVDGHAGDRPSSCDRQAAPGRGDAGFDLGDLLGQDRNLDAEQDDRAGVGDSGRASLHGVRGGIQHRWRDQARRRGAARSRPVLVAHGALC
jgi:hypothetical protein